MGLFGRGHLPAAAPTLVVPVPLHRRRLWWRGFNQSGLVFIDVGGGTTDVALVRQGGIEGTRMFALGGRAFTKSIADRLERQLARGHADLVEVTYALLS